MAGPVLSDVLTGLECGAAPYTVSDPPWLPMLYRVRLSPMPRASLLFAVGSGKLKSPDRVTGTHHRGDGAEGLLAYR